MDLPIDKEEFDEIVDALCSEHVDPRKREYRDKLHSKMKLLQQIMNCLLYTSPSPRDKRQSRMPSSA